MRTVLILSLLATSLVGCVQDPVPVGFDMSDFFPLDNSRTWTFDNMDQDLDYFIDASLTINTEPGEQVTEAGDKYQILHYEARCIDGVEECGAGFLYDIYMSEGPYGIALHGYETPETGQVLFSDRLRLGPSKMARGDDIVSVDIDGHTFTSTFLDIEMDGTIGPDGEPIAEELGCDKTMSGPEWECVHMVVESDPPGHWLAGDWWASAGWNVVAWNRTDDDGKWRAIDVENVRQ